MTDLPGHPTLRRLFVISAEGSPSGLYWRAKLTGQGRVDA